MFNTYEFIYNEIPSSMYGLFICDFDGTNNESVSFGNKADIIERRVNNRVSPLHFGVDYNKEPLSFKLVFASYNELDRWDMQEIANWLTGYSDYKWLYIEQCDMENLGYRCLITDLTPLHVGWAPYAFEATIRCDCPYAYGPYKSEEFALTPPIPVISFTINNEGSARVNCKPKITFEKTEGTTEIITEKVGHDGKRYQLVISEIPSEIKQITVDNQNQILSSDNPDIDLYSNFNNQFISLVPSDNLFVCFGVDRVTIEWQEYYNAGA